MLQELNQKLEEKGTKRIAGTFMRKGKAGDWKEHFTPELEERFEEWEAKWLKGTSLQFEYGV